MQDIVGGVVLLEYPTDQIRLYSHEAGCAVQEVMKSLNISLAEAVEIVRIGAYNLRTEVIKHTSDNSSGNLEVKISDE